ncbi:MAG: hypothetical protein ACPGTU_03375 [Myxococcota bacterium]
MRHCILFLTALFFISGCVYYEADMEDSGSGMTDWCTRLENTACDSCSYETCQSIRRSIDYGASQADCRVTFQVYAEHGCPG